VADIDHIQHTSRLDNLERQREVDREENAKTARGVAALNAKLDSVVDSMQTITGRMNQPSQSWTAILSVGLTLLLVIGAVGMLAITPLQNTQQMALKILSDSQKIQVDESKAQAYERGRLEALISWNQSLAVQVRENTDRSVANKATIEGLGHALQGLNTRQRTHSHEAK